MTYLAHGHERSRDFVPWVHGMDESSGGSHAVHPAHGDGSHRSKYYFQMHQISTNTQNQKVAGNEPPRPLPYLTGKDSGKKKTRANCLKIVFFHWLGYFKQGVAKVENAAVNSVIIKNLSIVDFSLIVLGTSTAKP